MLDKICVNQTHADGNPVCINDLSYAHTGPTVSQAIKKAAGIYVV